MLNQVQGFGELAEDDGLGGCLGFLYPVLPVKRHRPSCRATAMLPLEREHLQNMQAAGTRLDVMQGGCVYGMSEAISVNCRNSPALRRAGIEVRVKTLT